MATLDPGVVKWSLRQEAAVVVDVWVSDPVLMQKRDPSPTPHSSATRTNAHDGTLDGVDNEVSTSRSPSIEPGRGPFERGGSFVAGAWIGMAVQGEQGSLANAERCGLDGSRTGVEETETEQDNDDEDEQVHDFFGEDLAAQLRALKAATLSARGGRDGGGGTRGDVSHVGSAQRWSQGMERKHLATKRSFESLSDIEGAESQIAVGQSVSMDPGPADFVGKRQARPELLIHIPRHGYRLTVHPRPPHISADLLVNTLLDLIYVFWL